MPEIKDEIYLKPEDITTEPMPFTIVNAGEYVDVPVEDTTKEVLNIGIELQGGIARTYSPNKTSRAILTRKHGPNTDDWVGKTGELITKQQNVRGVDKTVIYVKE